MIVPFGKVMHRSSSSNDGSVHDFNKSVNKHSESTTEISPSKFRSPPPKPPRRRHSDQLSDSPSGTFPSSKKKPIDGNQAQTKHNMPKTSNNKSGCGSLPANWTADFQGIDDATVHKHSVLPPSKPRFDLTSNNKSSMSNETSEKCITSLKDDTTCNAKDNVFFIRTHLKPSHATQFLKPNFSSNQNQQKHCTSKNVETVSNRYDLSESVHNDNELCNVKSLQKEFPRRHHSDPVVSSFDYSSKKCSFPKSCSQRSHSLIRNVISSNKCCNSDENYCVSKETQCLFEEIKGLKEMNDKVWEHLCSVQAAFDNFKRSSPEDQSPLSVSELLSQLYYAQKAKDCAMEERLRLVLEERDAIAAELEEMVQAVARNFEESESVCDDEISENDKEIKELLQEIETTQNPSKLLQQQRVLLSYLYRSKEAKQDRLSHELRLSNVERDNALEKVKQLEEELKYTKLSNDIWHFDTKHWETSLLDILCQVIEQRDSNIGKNQTFQELSHNKEYRSLKSSSTGLQSNSDYESLQKLDQKLNESSSDANTVYKCFRSSPIDAKKCFQFSIETPQDEIKVLKEEIFVLTKTLEDEIKRRENSEENCLRLERLVNVLRKKINGQNVGVPL